MGDFLNLVSAYSWPALLGAVLLLGFAPGFTLRLILLCYPSDHPRRQELLAELYGMSRIERLFFVAEQFEVALFEGLPVRASQRAKKKRRKNEESVNVIQVDKITGDVVIHSEGYDEHSSVVNHRVFLSEGGVDVLGGHHGRFEFIVDEEAL